MQSVSGWRRRHGALLAHWENNRENLGKRSRCLLLLLPVVQVLIRHQWICTAPTATTRIQGVPPGVQIVTSLFHFRIRGHHVRMVQQQSVPPPYQPVPNIQSPVVKVPPPPIVEQSVQKIMPAPLIPAQPPREEKQEQKQDNGLSVQKRAEDIPPKVIEVPLQEAVPGDEKEHSRVGQQFGNYKLLRSLGEGGFAEVYLGEHIHLGSYAAIKILAGRLTGEEQEKFRQEARTLVRLVHPNIVRLLEFGIEDKVPFLVMDYATNGTLRQRHPKGSRVPLPLVVNYVKQAAEALQFAHDLKCIHRDIKPENMLVGSRNEILLSDFGIAIVAQSSRYQNPQDMAGTVTYMAPEQIQLHPRPASDQYSLGVVTYEWLCGSRPFQGSFTEIAVKHATVLPPPLRQKVSTISLPVEQAVLKSLAKDPKERFESVQAFAIALEQASLR